MKFNKGDRVKVISEYVESYGMIGTVSNAGNTATYVTFDNWNGQKNKVVSLKNSRLELIGKLEENDMSLLGYKNIAVVNLLEDYYTKDYGFALYDDVKSGDLVVVNAGSKNKRVLGIVKSVVTTEEYGKGVTAEVIGIVNLENFNRREAEKVRQEELKKKKIAVENELRNKIEKLRDIEFYEKMAMEFADKDPDIVRLVGELKNLSTVEV